MGGLTPPLPSAQDPGTYEAQEGFCDLRPGAILRATARPRQKKRPVTCVVLIFVTCDLLISQFSRPLTKKTIVRSYRFTLS